jgi:hypothetical protein
LKGGEPMKGKGKRLIRSATPAQCTCKRTATGTITKVLESDLSPMPGRKHVSADTATEACSIPSSDSEAMVSSCSEAEERVATRARSSQLSCDQCWELLHQLSNTMTGVLMNAQVLGWKLPPYSHLKRPLRELERNAQRVGELLRRLMQRSGEESADTRRDDHATQTASVVTVQEPSGPARRSENLSPLSPAPGFLPASLLHVTGECDRCTSSHFPKGDDGKER